MTHARTNHLIVALLAVALLAGGCRDSSPAAPGVEVPLEVAVVNEPLRCFAERIGGDDIVVRFPVLPGVDPAFWEPDAPAMKAYHEAEIIFLNGATYAKWVERAPLPPTRCVDTSAAFAASLIEIEDATTHRHGPAGEHAHDGIAFTTWLDFDQARRQAEAVRDALVVNAPDHRAAFEANHAALAADLAGLDEAMTVLGARLGDRPLLASHPVYQYWARRYGANVRALTWEPDVVPDRAAWHDLEHALEDHPATLMLWEGAPAAETAQRLAEMGIAVVVFDPCGNTSDEGDFLAVMRANVDRLEAALE